MAAERDTHCPRADTEYNPRYFDDPKEYRPSRWYDVSNESEAFSAFSIGNQALSSSVMFKEVSRMADFAFIRPPNMHRAQIRHNGGGCIPHDAPPGLQDRAHAA